MKFTLCLPCRSFVSCALAFAAPDDDEALKQEKRTAEVFFRISINDDSTRDMPTTPQSSASKDIENLSPEDRSRIIEMAWDDRTPFEAIFEQFGLRENDVRKLMRRSMKDSSFRRWRERVSGRATKHEKLSPTHQQAERKQKKA